MDLHRSTTAAMASPEPPSLEGRAFPLLIWAAWSVQQEYVDPARFEPEDQLRSALRFLGLQTPEFFAVTDAEGGSVEVTVRAAKSKFSLGSLDTLVDAAERLEEILKFAQSVLDLDEESLHELEYTAINGLFAALDPHTILLTPEQHADLGVRTRGHFGGIGAEIRADERRIRVVRVIEGGPAAKAGLLSGDLLLRIGRQSTVNMTSAEAQGLLRGPVGNPVDLKVRRGKRSVAVKIVRDTITIPSVHDARLPGRVGYVRISTFQENTGERVRKVLGELRDGPGGVRGVVLDLRGNSGGLLTQATEVVNALVAEGDLVIVRSAREVERDQATEETVVDPDVSFVVLVDEESASASEIVSGGLKALGRGIVLGRGTFGKGSVQMLKPATPYGRELALKMTVAEYLVHGKKRIQTTGVIPDLELLPVEVSDIPGVARYFDEERFERLRERSRVAHLPSAKHEQWDGAATRPAHRLRYLWTSELPSKEDLPVGTDPSLAEEMRDPEVRIARMVAEQLAGIQGRGELLVALQRQTDGLQAREDARIDRAVAKTGVSWGAGGGTDGAFEVQARLVSEHPLVAGAPFRLAVEFKNPGQRTLRRVHLMTDCEKDELDGIELLVGEVAPGATVERTLELQIMAWRTEFTDKLRLDVHVGEPNETPDATTNVLLDVAAPPRPVFSYDYWIVDDPTLVERAPARARHDLLPGEEAFRVEGNGDGVLQPGERVVFAFVAVNAGPGVAGDARAVLRNHSGKQGLLEEGTVNLGRVGPGHEASGAFGITISPDADPALPFEVEFMVGDVRLRDSVSHKLRLQISPQGDTLAAEPAVVTATADLRLYAGAHPRSEVVGRAPAGTVLNTVGKMGAWRVLEKGLSGRRYFVPVDLTEVEGAGHQLDRVARRAAVVPPRVTVENLPRRTAEGAVQVTGIATHPDRVRDVMISWLPSGTARMEEKVYYQANSQADGGGVSAMRFTAEVPLEPGANRIVVIARDGAKVERQRELWVYRDEARE